MVVNFELQKGLDAGRHPRMFHNSPRFLGRRRKQDGETNQGRQAAVPPTVLLEPSRIGIDGRNAEVLAGTLSPSGRLFEIYFVRLIGTPNQESKGCRLRPASS